MPGIVKTKALVINALRWHESSKIVTLYSRELGKIKVIARGALRPKSPFGGMLETMNLIEAVISSKQSRELQILTEAALVNPFSQIRLQLDKLPYALSILELINQTIEERQADEIFFDFSARLLEAAADSENPEIILWYFLLKLSSFLGFKPNISECSFCKNTSLDGRVYFNPWDGEIICGQCTSNMPAAFSLKQNELAVLQILQKYPYKKIHEFKLPAGINKNFTSILLDYLNLHIERNIVLKSLELLI